jgi:hypothetical protein
MTQAIKEKKQIFDFVYNLSDIAAKQDWVFRYDPESDELSVTVPKLSKDARIRYVNDEIALYYSKNNQIEGLFIEYFRHNFIQHQSAFKNLKNLVNKITKKQPVQQDGLVEFSWKKIEKIASDFDDAIKFSLVKDIQLQV